MSNTFENILKKTSNSELNQKILKYSKMQDLILNSAKRNERKLKEFLREKFDIESKTRTAMESKKYPTGDNNKLAQEEFIKGYIQNNLSKEEWTVWNLFTLDTSSAEIVLKVDSLKANEKKLLINAFVDFFETKAAESGFSSDLSSQAFQDFVLSDNVENAKSLIQQRIKLEELKLEENEYEDKKKGFENQINKIVQENILLKETQNLKNMTSLSKLSKDSLIENSLKEIESVQKFMRIKETKELKAFKANLEKAKKGSSVSQDSLLKIRNSLVDTLSNLKLSTTAALNFNKDEMRIANLIQGKNQDIKLGDLEENIKLNQERLSFLLNSFKDYESFNKTKIRKFESEDSEKKKEIDKVGFSNVSTDNGYYSLFLNEKTETILKDAKSFEKSSFMKADRSLKTSIISFLTTIPFFGKFFKKNEVLIQDNFAKAQKEMKKTLKEYASLARNYENLKDNANQSEIVGINSDFKVAEETLKEILTKIKKLETEEELIQSACIDYDNSNFGQNKINYELELGKFARTLKITEFKNDNSLDPGVRTTDSVAPPQIFDSSAKENKYIIDLYRQVKITEAINNMKNNVDVVRDSTGVIITDDTARKTEVKNRVDALRKNGKPLDYKEKQALTEQIREANLLKRMENLNKQITSENKEIEAIKNERGFFGKILFGYNSEKQAQKPIGNLKADLNLKDVSLASFKSEERSK